MKRKSLGNPPLAGLDLKEGDGIVIFGESITHQRLYTQYLGDYFSARFSHLRRRLHNAGVSGSVAWKALEHFPFVGLLWCSLKATRLKPQPAFASGLVTSAQNSVWVNRAVSEEERLAVAALFPEAHILVW